MGLLSPWFLAGLGLLSLPLYLHLLKRHKSTPQKFSSLMFFERSTTASVRQRRLDYLPLLALRLALLAFIVFAFSRPFVQTSAAAAGQGAKTVLVVLDESASMAFGDRIDRAKSGALEVLRGRAARDKAQVATFGSRMKLLTEATQETGVLAAAVGSVKVGSSRSSLGDLASALRNLAHSSPLPLEVHVFSDLQRTSMPPGFSELRLDPQTKLALHRLAEKEEPNWTVETVAAPRRVVDTSQARVEATVAGFHTPEAQKEVALIVNGKTLARKTVTVPASGRAKVEFAGLDAPYGFNRGEVALTQSDQLPADDRALFAVERADPDKILLAYGPRSQRSALYFRSALETAEPGLFAVEAAPVAAAANRNLDGYSAVILSDPGAIPAAFDASLKKFVEQHGGLMIAVGTATVAAGKLPVLGLAVRGSSYESREGDRFATLGEADLTHPAVRRTERWDGVRFYQSFDVDSGDARVVAKLTSGKPILLEKRLGAGRVLVFTSTLDNDGNDFPLRPAFLPFVDETTRWLAAIEERASALTVDSSLDLRGDGSRASSVEVLDPDGNRALTLSESSSANSLNLDRAGFWEVRRSGARRELVAVNIDRRESDLAPMPADSAELWQASPGETRAAGDGSGGTNEPGRRNLWPYILAAALLAGLAETAVASKYFSREAA